MQSIEGASRDLASKDEQSWTRLFRLSLLLLWGPLVPSMLYSGLSLDVSDRLVVVLHFQT